ncbi:hypothetical protein [Flavitalea sp.]|nr:hypothetical protein [Flavitalea sp.]
MQRIRRAEGKPLRILQEGEVLNVLTGIKHWHGAKKQQPSKRSAESGNSTGG